MLEHQALIVLHTSPGFSGSRGKPTFGYSGRAIDQHTTPIGQVFDVPII
jgi:hypothetical protein